MQYHAIALLLALLFQPLAAAGLSAEVDRRPSIQVLYHPLRCSISLSKFNCVEIVVNNCRSSGRCNGGDGSTGGGIAGEIVTSINKGEIGNNECTTNVPGKSCQDLLDAGGGDTITNGQGGLLGDGGIGFSGPSQPAPKIESNYPGKEQIKVTALAAVGNETKELTASMISNQQAATGLSSFGATSIVYQVESPDTAYSSISGLQITSIKLKATVKQFMPTWPGLASATPDMKKCWTKMYEALVVHEWTHVTKGKQMGAILKKHIGKMPITHDPEAFKQAWDKAYADAEAEMQGIQDAWDDDDKVKWPDSCP